MFTWWWVFEAMWIYKYFIIYNIIFMAIQIYTLRNLFFFIWSHKCSMEFEFKFYRNYFNMLYYFQKILFYFNYSFLCLESLFYLKTYPSYFCAIKRLFCNILIYIYIYKTILMITFRSSFENLSFAIFF